VANRRFGGGRRATRAAINCHRQLCRAARFLDAGEQVDAVAMPAPILSALDAFVAAHYKPEPRRKGRRNELYEDAAARRRDDGRQVSLRPPR
jgi:hypothetical protein